MVMQLLATKFLDLLVVSTDARNPYFVTLRSSVIYQIQCAVIWFRLCLDSRRDV